MLQQRPPLAILRILGDFEALDLGYRFRAEIFVQFAAPCHRPHVLVVPKTVVLQFAPKLSKFV
jgi:hypothetical protein